MARIVFTSAAAAHLDRLIDTHSLPLNTWERVAASLHTAELFPLAGAPLRGRWEGCRYLPGPWRWMALVYREDDDDVVVLAVHDVRDSRSVGGEV